MRIFTVDCFSDRPFSGNPNAVGLISSAWPREEWLQQLAAEVNLPATAFVRQVQPLPELRWFSPNSELKLCGSGTLAAAHILSELDAGSATMTFATCAGQLGAQREPDQRITLDFPADDPHPIPVPLTISAALGTTALAAARGRYDLLAEVDSLEVVRELKPDLAAMASLDMRGLIVTAAGNKADCDFVSRYFAPGAGIDEDPVTASAHCTLGAYWSTKLNKTVMIGRQLSARGGRVDVRLRGGRVDLSGRAVTVTRGELVI